MAPPAQTVESVRAEIANLRSQRNAAQARYDANAAAALQDQLDALQDALPDVREAEIEHERAFVGAFFASQREAEQTYPDTADINSPLYRQMVVLEREMERTGDPAFHHPDKPRRLAAMAASMLGIAPRARGSAPAAPAAPLRPTPVAGLTPRAVPPSPASGGSRTYAPTNTATEQISQVLASTKDANDIMALTRGL